MLKTIELKKQQIYKLEPVTLHQNTEVENVENHDLSTKEAPVSQLEPQSEAENLSPTNYTCREMPYSSLTRLEGAQAQRNNAITSLQDRVTFGESESQRVQKPPESTLQTCKNDTDETMNLNYNLTETQTISNSQEKLV